MLVDFDPNISSSEVIPKPKTEKQLLRERMNSNTRRDSGTFSLLHCRSGKINLYLRCCKGRSMKE